MEENAIIQKVVASNLNDLIYEEPKSCTFRVPNAFYSIK
jgi:hypothetical protein